MEQNAENGEVDGVLLQTDAATIFNTPMAKKTRRAVRNFKKTEIEEECEIADKSPVAAPKTPSAAANTNMLGMTPRRSARKSVRPPLDYDDIIDQSNMLGKDKVKHINADTEVIEGQAAQKWNTAEVGRNSRKRSRKSKRKGNKNPKIDEEQLEEAEVAAVVIQPPAESASEDPPQSKEESDTDVAPQSEKDTDTEQPEKETAKEETEIEYIPQSEEKTKTNRKSRISHASETDVILCSSDESLDKITKMEAKVSNEDMDDLGLFPLDVKADLDEEDHDMPSLIMLDDAEPDDVLNRTFDADDNSSRNKCLPHIDSSQLQQSDVIENLAVSTQEPTKVAIKVVLTDENEQNITIKLRESLSAKKSLRHRDLPTTSNQNLNPLDSLKPGKPRRSNSTSDLNDTAKKNVAFFGSIQVTDISEIDKRWEGLDKSHITQRRKRSKSLDIFVSKIPKPKTYPPIRPITPSKTSTRTKLPNFAAIHQRQFNNMENLVQHVERKAVRAKELTNSALKQPPTGSSAKKVSVKKATTTSVLPADRSRSRVVKKIVLPNRPITPVKPEQRKLPVPRKIVEIPKSTTKVSRNPLVSNITKSTFARDLEISSNRPVSNMAKSAFNLSTLMAKESGDALKNKVKDRRERHMEMFKGRAGKEKKGDFIRGVRSNRRFELQMQHRQQMNENT